MSRRREEKPRTWAMVMPLVTTRSEGGLHDDDSYVAGWEMGEIFSTLNEIRPREIERFVRTESLPMVDLIAMRFGYKTTSARDIDGWTWIRLHRGKETIR